MLLKNLLEYATKTGRSIEFNRNEDTEADKNRGWQVDQIEAVVDEQVVGYIKISYIPHARFVKHYKHIFSWMSKIKGKSYIPFEKQDTHPTKLSPKEQRAFLKSVLHGERLVQYGGERVVDDMSDSEVVKKIKGLEEYFLNSHLGKEFKEFKNFHKDKPLVDFIRVKRNWRRQRVGEALYQEAAKWMKEKGMKLYASGLQTDEAKASWAHMKKNLKVQRAKRGRKTLAA